MMLVSPWITMSRRQTKMPLSDPQLSIARDPHRFRVAVCGRRFGKTFLARNQIAKYSRYPNQLVWYVAPTYRQAKGIMWKPLKTRLREINWVKKVNETELTIELVNNTTIQLKGADNPDSLRGLGLNFLIFDETGDIDPDAWNVCRPMLSDTGGHALFLGTPKGMNWFKDLYDRQIIDPANWRSWQYTTLDGKNVPQEEIEQARRDLDSKTFAAEYLASFENFTGRVAYNFSRQHHVVDLPPDLDQRILHVGMDFNVNPMTACILVQQGDTLYAIDEIRISNSNTLELVIELKNRYPRSEIRAYPDPSGASRKTSSGGQTDHIILRNNHIKVNTYNQHKPVKDRIAALNSRLMNDRGDIKLFFSKKLKYTIESLERYVYKDQTQIPDKSGYDHMFDALSYCVEYLYPIKRLIKPTAPERWTHKIGA